MNIWWIEFWLWISRWRLKKYRDVFLGTELVDWLILVGLAHDRSQALRYGRYLLSGRLIRHVANEYHFHDQPFFYTFQSTEQRNSSWIVQQLLNISVIFCYNKVSPIHMIINFKNNTFFFIIKDQPRLVKAQWNVGSQLRPR